MKIAGFQKLTLIDYPGKIACTLFLHGCNFRCGFCHNPELVIKKPEMNYSKEEILDFLSKRKKYLGGVCFTGGEPLIAIEKNFLRQIKSLGYNIKIDTNGSFPEKLKEIIDEKLVDFIAIDIKGSKEKYKDIANSDVDIKQIERSFRIASDFGSYEFRTTILEKFHDEKEIEKIGNWINKICEKKPKKYYLQGFKNSGKFIDEKYKMEKDTSRNHLNKLKKVAENYFESVGVRK
jgi:pyruvate formate lyase activating enzyme